MIIKDCRIARPEFKVPLANVYGRVGETIRLECVVSGKPRPDLCWKLNSKPFMPANANVSDSVRINKNNARMKVLSLYII